MHLFTALSRRIPTIFLGIANRSCKHLTFKSLHEFSSYVSQEHIYNQQQKLLSKKDKSHILSREAQRHYDQGNRHFQSAQYKLAIDFYLKAIKEDQQEPKFYIQLAKTLILEEEYDQALQVLYEGHKKIPQDQKIVLWLTELQLANDNYNQAFQLFLTIKQQDQRQNDLDSVQRTQLGKLLHMASAQLQNLTVWLQLKDYFLRQAVPSTVVTFFQYVLKTHKTYEILLSFGSFFFESGEITKAKAPLLQAAEINPDSYQVNLYLGTITLHEQKFREAINFFQKAIELNKQQSMPLSSVGLIYVSLNEHKNAKKYLEEALNVNRNDAIALSTLGSLEIQEGLYKQGIERLRSALEIDPLNQSAKRYLQTTQFLLGKEKRGK